MISRFSIYLFLLPGALGAQPSAPSPTSAPLRDLPWGQLNFLQTTDTHGWHGGHLQEAQYSADWGDYISFANHLRHRADEDGSDLLLVDTGDRVEGNGLYDASNPKGKYTFEIIKQQHIDIITPGNHELYQKNSSNNEFYRTVPNFKDGYIASNLDIYNPKNGSLEPLAPRYRKFTTKNQGIRILAFGFIFDFKGNANNTVVQPVEDTIKEKWFQEAIRDKDVDLFVVAGHVPVRDSREFDAIHTAIRSQRLDTPIQFFGGHTHIRDYHKWDSKAYGLESGRYMETIGFTSITGLASAKKEVSAYKSLKYERRYIDNNLFSMYHHTGLNSTTFPTEHGRNVSAEISSARASLNLDKAYGCAPKTYWLNRAQYPSDESLLTWLEKSVLPDAGHASSAADGSPMLIITNSGAMRFDIFEGPFTIDTTFLVSPFISGFRELKNVPYKSAARISSLLNNEGQILVEELMAFSSQHVGIGKFGPRALSQLAPPYPPVGPLTKGSRPIYESRDHQVLAGVQKFLMDSPNSKLVPGYTTTDDAGADGDDTIHAPITFYDVPNVIQATVHFGRDEKEPVPDTVDLIYNEFIEKWVLLALRFLGENRTVEETSSTFDGKTFTELISDWVHKNWACK
ncbi:Ser/Thr protein phosphatase [Delphinella strobiligena]|nr:Ser/Thr protein phosphatase [Delphinella strobiligena]